MMRKTTKTNIASQKILFSQGTRMSCEQDRRDNAFYLTVQENYINGLLVKRGYVYLNQIYETLGLKWNPRDENECYIYGDCEAIRFHITETKQGFDVWFSIKYFNRKGE